MWVMALWIPGGEVILYREDLKAGFDREHTNTNTHTDTHSQAHTHRVLSTTGLYKFKGEWSPCLPVVSAWGG